jgi:hypothetical protein
MLGNDEKTKVKSRVVSRRAMGPTVGGEPQKKINLTK